jgi:ABC-type branched-subunit amino acid transport system ATPase component
MMSEIRAEGIHAGYGKKEILRGITIAAGKGELVAIIGPNGAGKSTLLKVIAGFLRPGRGTVTLDGRNITRTPPHERVKQGIGYFMQGGRVFDGLTVDENLAMGAATGERRSRREELTRVLDLFPKLGEFRDRRAGLLSGGERQALALAMTLVHRPNVLLLDEPSAGLSPKLVGEMLDRVDKVCHEWQLAVLMVEQNVRQALSFAHRACVLVDGVCVIDEPSPRSLLSGSKLEQVFLGHACKPNGGQRMSANIPTGGIP